MAYICNYLTMSISWSHNLVGDEQFEALYYPAELSVSVSVSYCAQISGDFKMSLHFKLVSQRKELTFLLGPLIPPLSQHDL